MSLDDFQYFCEEVFGKIGPPPHIGTFEPSLGDVGLADDGKPRIWTGSNWHPPITVDRPADPD